MDELPLAGARSTAGVVRVGETVRRPQGARSPYVHELLLHLERVGFDRAPRFLGTDEQGREILSFVEGMCPPDLDASFGDAVLVAAAELTRDFHAAVAGCELAGGEEVVCHNDLSPCNVAFRNGAPWGLIDFEDAAPGTRRHELAYALFMWLNVGTDGPPPAEQGRRARLMLEAYGAEPSTALAASLVAGMTRLAAAKRDWRLARGLEEPGGWWHAQHEWLLERGVELARAISV